MDSVDCSLDEVAKITASTQEEVRRQDKGYVSLITEL